MQSKDKYLSAGVSYLKLWKRTLLLIKAVVPGWTLAWLVLLTSQGLIPGATVYLTKLTIDSFLLARDDLTHLNSSLLLLGLTGGTLVLAEVFQFLSSWVRTVQADTLTDHLKNLIHLKAGEVDFQFYESSSYHDLLEQVKGNSISRPLALLESFGDIFQSVITLLTFSTLLLSYGWWVPFVLLLGALPALFLYLRSERVMHKWTRESTPQRRWLMYFDTILTSNFAAAEVRLYKLSSYFRQRYQKLSLRLRREKLHHLKHQFGGRLLAGILALVTAGIAVGWMALKVLNKTATLGDLAVFYQVFSRGQSILQSLLGGINKTFSSSLYLENLFEFLDLEPQIVAPPEPVPCPGQLEHGIRFSNVSFSYPGEKRMALKNFNLFIPAGKIVALVGVNGAGKSTLIKLLCRFYNADEGVIEIDGIDIRNFDPAELQRKLSVYFQFPLHYHETVNHNITFGDIERLDDTKAVQVAAEQSGAIDFIESLPEKYETMLGKYFADGCELSGGQWQRLTLARAYFRQTPILILDEPTSFMDSWSEAQWFDHLRELLVGRTGLVITHRFTIAMRADIIQVIDGGRIIESGSHQELLRENGFYAQSWNSQMQAADEDDSQPENPGQLPLNLPVKLY